MSDKTVLAKFYEASTPETPASGVEESVFTGDIDLYVGLFVARGKAYAEVRSDIELLTPSTTRVLEAEGEALTSLGIPKPQTPSTMRIGTERAAKGYAFHFTGDAASNDVELSLFAQRDAKFDEPVDFADVNAGTGRTPIVLKASDYTGVNTFTVSGVTYFVVGVWSTATVGS